MKYLIILLLVFSGCATEIAGSVVRASISATDMPNGDICYVYHGGHGSISCVKGTAK